MALDLSLHSFPAMIRRQLHSCALVPALALLAAACGGGGGFSSGDGGEHDGDGGSGHHDAGVEVDAGPHEIGELGPGLSTLVGYSEPGRVNGPREFALFNNPVNTAVGPDGFVYVCDFDNGLIRRISTDGNVETLTEGASFVRPFGITFSQDGDLYVQTDRTTTGAATGSLWTIDIDTGAADLVTNDIGRVRGLASLSDGRLVMADYQGHTVSIFNPENNEKTLLAGEFQAPGYEDGVGAAARFHVPYDVAVTPDDEIFVVDHTNHSLRKVTLDGQVTTVVGDGIPETLDGDFDTARLNFPKGITRDAYGNLYITDTGSGVVRRVDLDDGVTTIAGSGTPGFADAENPLEAQLYGIEGIDVDDNNKFLYIADGNNGTNGPYHRVRRLEITGD